MSVGYHAQSVSGFVYDEENTPVPFANVYIKNLQTGTSTDVQGRYFYQFSQHGVYQLVITALGFEDQEISLVINENKTYIKNIWLKHDAEVLNEIVVKEKSKDPAYGIIRKAIDNREKWNTQISSSTCKVYIKAKEIISEREKKRRARKQKNQDIQEKENPDVFEEEERKKKQEISKIANSTNMIEIDMIRHYQAPNKIKEVRTGFKKYGSSYGLFFKNTIENEFNFYDGLVKVSKLNEVPLISPLNTISFVTYKFELLETVFEDGHLLHKIKVEPRKKGNANFTGIIWVQDSTFHLKKVDLSIYKGGLIIYDEFNIKQEYEFIEDSVLIIKRQEFNYSSKTKNSKFKGQTIVRYSDYDLSPNFPKKFFKNEVGVTTKEAYERDSSYWDKIRPEPLTKDEQKFQKIKDSIYELTHSEKYLDSIDSVFNKITPLDLLWDGVYFTNRKEKRFWGFSSLAGLIDPFEIGGIRIGPNVTYFKKFENEKFFRFDGQVNWSIQQNWDTKGYISTGFRYDPMHNGVVSFYGGRQFDIVVMNDALSNLFVRNNWIENDFLIFGHQRELLNGLLFNTVLSLSERRSIEGYNFLSITDSLFGVNDVTPFQTYQTTKIGLRLSYTPFQKYMKEPYRKVILGSDWPTFSVLYEKGLNGLLGSDINFDYIEGEIKQNFQLYTLGTSSYKLNAGKFINTNDLRYVDYKIFPRGDQWFFASLMQSMQIQDTSLFVTNSFMKAHFIHHFNGAIINFLPLIKKLALKTVVGTSALYIKELNYKYWEWFGGIERTFRIDRRRLRLGVYVVDAVSNYSSITPRIKFAINFYSVRDNTWGY